MDIAYLSEVDPLWNDSTLSMLINPEAALFGNLIAQGACAADAAAHQRVCRSRRCSGVQVVRVLSTR
jgi:hypothetical protein